MSVKKLTCKCHFVIIPDLHQWHKNIRNRKNYVKECLHAIEQVKKIILQTREKYPRDKIFLVLLGDVFHREVPDTDSYNALVQMWTQIRAMVNSIFAVVGNHEFTYYKDNPFWGLVNRIDSEYVKMKGMQAKGTLPVFQVIDHLDVFDTRMHFAHFGTGITEVHPKQNVLFAHDYWSTNEIINTLALEIDNQTLKKYSKGYQINDDSPLQFFKYGFFGHNHLLLGAFQIAWDNDYLEDTTLYYLGSLGLTQKGEVQGRSADRFIPVLTIDENGPTVETHPIKLLFAKEEVLDYVQIAKTEKEYERTVRLKNLKQAYVLNGQDPLELLRNEMSASPELAELLHALEEGGVPECTQKYMIF